MRGRLVHVVIQQAKQFDSFIEKLSSLRYTILLRLAVVQYQFYAIKMRHFMSCIVRHLVGIW